MKKFLCLISLILILGFAGQASALNIIGGVTWDPNSDKDFLSTSADIHQDIDGDINSATFGQVSGWGFVTEMNGLTDFVAPGAQLEIVFEGYEQAYGDLLPSITGSTSYYTGGLVNIYYDGSSTGSDEAEATDMGDNLWLSLAAHGSDIVANDGTSLQGITLVGVFSTLFQSLQGVGNLDVVGGVAANYFNTNTIETPDGSFADLNFVTAFGLAGGGGSILNADGVGTFTGDSVPEPATMLLFGIGLLGLAGMGRRKA